MKLIVIAGPHGWNQVNQEKKTLNKNKLLRPKPKPPNPLLKQLCERSDIEVLRVLFCFLFASSGGSVCVLQLEQVFISFVAALLLFVDSHNPCISWQLGGRKYCKSALPCELEGGADGEMFPNWLFLVYWGWRGKEKVLRKTGTWNSQAMLDLWVEGLALLPYLSFEVTLLSSVW